MSCSGDVQAVIDNSIEFCALNWIDRDDMIRASMLLLMHDLRANGDSEHNLINEDGVLLLNVRLMS